MGGPQGQAAGIGQVQPVQAVKRGVGVVGPSGGGVQVGGEDHGLGLGVGRDGGAAGGVRVEPGKQLGQQRGGVVGALLVAVQAGQRQQVGGGGLVRGTQGVEARGGGRKVAQLSQQTRDGAAVGRGEVVAAGDAAGGVQGAVAVAGGAQGLGQLQLQAHVVGVLQRGFFEQLRSAARVAKQAAGRGLHDHHVQGGRVAVADFGQQSLHLAGGGGRIVAQGRVGEQVAGSLGAPGAPFGIGRLEVLDGAVGQVAVGPHHGAGEYAGLHAGVLRSAVGGLAPAGQGIGVADALVEQRAVDPPLGARVLGHGSVEGGHRLIGVTPGGGLGGPGHGDPGSLTETFEVGGLQLGNGVKVVAAGGSAQPQQGVLTDRWVQARCGAGGLGGFSGAPLPRQHVDAEYRGGGFAGLGPLHPVDELGQFGQLSGRQTVDPGTGGAGGHDRHAQAASLAFARRHGEAVGLSLVAGGQEEPGQPQAGSGPSRTLLQGRAVGGLGFGVLSAPLVRVGDDGVEVGHADPVLVEAPGGVGHRLGIGAGAVFGKGGGQHRAGGAVAVGGVRVERADPLGRFGTPPGGVQGDGLDAVHVQRLHGMAALQQLERGRDPAGFKASQDQFGDQLGRLTERGRIRGVAQGCRGGSAHALLQVRQHARVQARSVEHLHHLHGHGGVAREGLGGRRQQGAGAFAVAGDQVGVGQHQVSDHRIVGGLTHALGVGPHRGVGLLFAAHHVEHQALHLQVVGPLKQVGVQGAGRIAVALVRGQPQGPGPLSVRVVGIGFQHAVGDG